MQSMVVDGEMRWLMEGQDVCLVVWTDGMSKTVSG